MTIKINGDNTVANPGFSGDDTDTGLQVGTNELKLVTGGTARATVDSSGNVGIGLTSPQTKFHSSGTTNGAQATFGISSAGLKISTFQKTHSDAGVTLDAQHSSHGTLRFSTTGTERLRIDSSGNVGIGTTSPGRNLVVNGGSSEGVLQITNNTSGTGVANGLEIICFTSGEVQFLNRENAAMRFDTNNTERMRINSSGKLLVGTASDYAENVQAAFYGASNGGIALASGTSGLSRLMFADAAAGQAGAYVGSIIYSHADDSLRFNVNGGSEAARIDSSKRLLIGSGAVSATKASNGGIDASSHNLSIVFGGSSLSGTTALRANNATKDGRIAAAHYTNSEEPVGVIRAVSSSTENQLHWGGGSSIINAATDHRFYTAANNTTTGGTERLRIQSSGGISFNGDTAQANALDDYEEGTWTPSISSFTTTGTVTTAGKYVKVGRQVTFGLRFKSTGTIAYGVSCNISLPFAMNYGDAHNGLVNMMLNSNSASQDNNRNGNQCKLDGEGGSRFFVGSFTTTTSGQELFFGGTYIASS